MSSPVLALAVLALRLSVPAPTAPLGFTLGIEGPTTLRVTLSGPAAELSPGPFTGFIALNGSASELPVAGTVSQAQGQWRLPAAVRYADVPADWADRFRPDGFTYRLRSAGSGPPRQWTGMRSWKDVALDGGRDALAEFLVLGGVSLTRVSLLSSEAVAQLSVRNPFAFELRIAAMEYVLVAEGRQVGSGQTQGRILHPGQNNVLDLPIDVDHGGLIAAAGGAVLSGGDVAVQLRGKLVVRLKGVDVVVPLALSGNLSDAS